jgi:hypothetical protein
MTKASGGHLRAFVDYYDRSRAHLGLQKDTPEARPIQAAEAARSSQSQRSVDSIIATSAAQPERLASTKLRRDNFTR